MPSNRGTCWRYQNLRGEVLAKPFLRDSYFRAVDFDAEWALVAFERERELIVVDGRTLNVAAQLDPEGVDPSDTNDVQPAFGPSGCLLAFGWPLGRVAVAFGFSIPLRDSPLA